jgi:hypothetical protein
VLYTDDIRYNSIPPFQGITALADYIRIIILYYNTLLLYIDDIRYNSIPPFQGITALAEFGTLQLEFKYLTHATGNSVYMDMV